LTTRPQFYSKITLEELGVIMQADSSSPIPLLSERFKCLHEAGQFLVDNYEGSFVNYLKANGSSAQNLLKKVVQDFESYRDEAVFEGTRVSFYKRAQILIADIWAHLEGVGLAHFDDIDSLTMFADYRVPQVLVHFGALKYNEHLLGRLKSGEQLQNGEREEVEIRGCSVAAVDLITDQVKERIKGQSGFEKVTVNPTLVDYFLWNYRRDHADELAKIPFHKVRCVYY